MPAPRRFWRFMYDRESASWERRRDEAAHRELVEQTADELARVVATPGPVADLGCGPGAHARALARRGYDVVGVDGSPRMVEVARSRATRDDVTVRFEVHDVGAPLPFADTSLGGVLAILVIPHLPDPAAFIAEIRRCLRPGGHLLITAPSRDSTPLTTGTLYWRLRAKGFHLVPGVIRFYDTRSLRAADRGQGADDRRDQRRGPRREHDGARVTSPAVDILDRPTPSLLVERGAFERNVATMATRWPGTQLRDRFPRLPPPLACMPRHEPTTRRTRRRLRASDESSLHRTSHLSRSHRGGSEGGSRDLTPNHTDTTMPELLIDFITSLDGYGAAEGWPGWWGLEGPEYPGWVEDSPEADYTVLMGAMRGWLRVNTDGVRTRRQLVPWVRRGIDYTRSLPPKPR